MVSTAHDYLRFANMLLGGGAIDGVRLLGRKTVELMTADHLPPGVTTPFPGYGRVAPGYGGELLGTPPSRRTSLGGPWSGTGPAPGPVMIPGAPSLAGVEVWGQGLMLDFSLGTLLPVGLTNAVWLELGS